MKTSFFQAAVVGAFILLAIIGLFVFATYTGSGTSSTSVGTVVIWGTFPSSGMGQALSQIGVAHTDLKGITYEQKSTEAFSADYVNALAAGKGPDLIIISAEDLAHLSPTLAPIPYSVVAERSYLDGFADIGRLLLRADSSYGVPFAIDPLILYYNRSLLSSAGIAAPPASWEAVVGLVPKVAKISDRQQVTRALIALGAYANVRDARGILSALFLQAGVPLSEETSSGIRANLSTGKSDSSIAPGEAVVRYYTSFANPAQSTYTWNSSMPDSRKAFLAGDLALYLGYASELPFIKSANPNLDFDIAPFPEPATAASRTVYGRLYALAIPKASANPSGALSAAVALSGTDNQKALAAAAGLPPARRDLLAAPPDNPYAPVMYREALIAKGWLSPSPASTDSVFAVMISSVITGASRLNEAVAAAERALSAAY